MAALESNSAIELVITDQPMPAMTGIQPAAAIRQRWLQMRILLATGHAGGAQLANLPLDKSFLQRTLALAAGAIAAPAAA